MKLKRFLFALILLFATVSLAGEPVQLAKTGQGIAGGGASAAACSILNPSACLFYETFDGATACGDGSHSNCVTSWTGAAPDFNYATALLGTYSIQSSPSGDNQVTYASFTGVSTAHAFGIFSFSDITTSTWGAGNFMNLRDSSGNIVASAKVQRTAVPSYRLQIQCGGAPEADSTTTITVETPYCIWFDYTKGTGNNAIGHAYIAAAGGTAPNLTCAKPASPEGTLTTGTSTADAARVSLDSMFLSTNFKIRWIADQIIINGVAF